MHVRATFLIKKKYYLYFFTVPKEREVKRRLEVVVRGKSVPKEREANRRLVVVRGIHRGFFGLLSPTQKGLLNSVHR
jgi:hypothetical protein